MSKSKYFLKGKYQINLKGLIERKLRA